MYDYREQLETSFKSIKKGKQPAKVKRKTELDWLKKRRRGRFMKTLEKTTAQRLRGVLRKQEPKERLHRKKGREEANLTFKTGLQN